MSLNIWNFEVGVNTTKAVSRVIAPHLKTVLVGGCFDVLHYGHLNFLQQAKSQGDFLSIALEPDEKIIKAKSRRPIHTQQQRAEILSSVRCVDEVILLPWMNQYEEYLRLVEILRPHYLAITANDPQLKNKERQANHVGATLVVVNQLIKEFSSSKLIEEFSD